VALAAILIVFAFLFACWAVFWEERRNLPRTRFHHCKSMASPHSSLSSHVAR